MDRGRGVDDGPDDAEAVTEDDRIDPIGAPGDGAPQEDAPSAIGAATEEGAGTEDADVAGDDARPAVWLADVRARAPWLLGPGGALRWRAAGPPAPDRVPHGVTPAEPRWGVAESGGRDGPGRPVPEPMPAPASGIRDATSADQNTAGGAGPPAAAGGPGGPQAGAPPADAISHPPDPSGIPPRTPDEESRTGAGAPSIDRAVGDGDGLDRDPGWPPVSWPANETPWDAAQDLGGLDAAASAAEPPGTSPHDPVPVMDPRRPAIHRSSATWSPPAARPPTSTPVWPSSAHPDTTGHPHQGSITQPPRPMQRPVMPFAPEPPRPTSRSTQAPGPTWAEDRSGWHPAAASAAQIVDEARLPPWPSLLGDDDDDEVVPDWATLERSYDRMLRLDREQRRR